MDAQQIYFLTGKTSDQIWDLANGYVSQMPDGLIEKHRGALTKLFTIHARTLQAEVLRRSPGETFMVQALDYVLKERIQKGDVREALRDLAVGVIAHLPKRGSMELDPRFENMIGPSTDKNIALHESVQKHGIGILPTTLRYVFEPVLQDAASYYAKNLGRIFPNPEQIKIIGP